MRTPPAVLKSYRENFLETIKHPDIVEIICGHMANGGSLLTLCETWEIRYSDLTMWMYADKARSAIFQACCIARDEWYTQKAMTELQRISDSDLREIFDERGNMKSPKDWPDTVAKSVMSVEVDELWGPDGKGGKEQIGVTRKIKLWPKIEAIKLQMQKLGILVERKQVTHTFNVAGKMAELEEAKKRARAAVENAIDVTPVAASAAEERRVAPTEAAPAIESQQPLDAA